LKVAHVRDLTTSTGKVYPQRANITTVDFHNFWLVVVVHSAQVMGKLYRSEASWNDRKCNYAQAANVRYTILKMVNGY
jgi:hypothetical protein